MAVRAWSSVSQGEATVPGLLSLPEGETQNTRCGPARTEAGVARAIPMPASRDTNRRSAPVNRLIVIVYSAGGTRQ